MKLLTLLLVLLFANAAAAQQTPIEKLPEKGYFPSNRGLQIRLKTPDSTRQHAVMVQPGLYKMRQYGMPCIVPDTEGMPVMPNAFGKKAKLKSQN